MWIEKHPVERPNLKRRRKEGGRRGRGKGEKGERKGKREGKGRRKKERGKKGRRKKEVCKSLQALNFVPKIRFLRGKLP